MNQSTAQPTNSLFGSRLGAQPMNNTAPGTTVPGVTIDLSNIKPTTKFSDLHKDVQDAICKIDDLIQQQIAYKEQVAAILPAHAQTMLTIDPDVKFVTERLSLVEMTLDNDASDVNRVKQDLKQDADEARLSFRAIENLKLPSQFHYSTIGGGLSGFPSSTARPAKNLSEDQGGEDAYGAVDLTSYFDTKTNALGEAVGQHKRHITEVEQHLGTVEMSTQQRIIQLGEAMDRGQMDGGTGAGSRGNVKSQIRELGDTLRAIETAILGLAGRVGEAREAVIDVSLGQAGQ